MSELALALIREAKENQSTFLDLGNCGLTELPAELFELVHLEVLYLCMKGGYYDENQKLVRFESKNEGAPNDIQYFSTKMRQLAKLRVLLANECQLGDLSPLQDLVNLQILTISATQVSDLSPLRDLVNLQTLSAAGTPVSDLSPLQDLSNLQTLYFPQTQVSDLSPVQDLDNLKILDVSYTPVSDLSPLRDLVNLQILDVSSTQVSDLSPLQGSSNLQELYFTQTQVSDLSPLKDLYKLQSLSAFVTQVRDLSPLQDLVNLQRLDISWTQVSDLSPLKTILERGILFNSGYEVSEIAIHVDNCPLINPPMSIAKQGNKAILRYWKEQERSGTRKVNEARLLVVGQGGAGKTTLKDKLIDAQAPMPEPDATTRGINIEPIQCKNREGDEFTVNIWDFGGQNIQHYAHQFFMSDSVVYAVLSNTREQNANFQYWLNIIELLGKNSPFFIVQNEKDGHTEGLKEIVKIQERFPETFQSVEQVNLKNAASDRRFVALKEKLFHSATQLPHTQKEVINSFFNVREKLATLSATEPTIPFATFRQYCRDEGIEDKNLMNDYALMMTELGIALYYPDDLHLKNTVFLSPKWLIDALFKLLYHPSVEQQNGQFTSAAADAIWSEPEYEDKHGLLIQVMEKFRLCFKTRGDTYIVPQRLPLRQEAFVPPADATHLIYQYKFLPSGFLTQLTCELHDKIEAEKVWSDAVQFVSKDGQGRVFARENNQDHKIELFGFGASKADLLNRAVEVIDDIHANTKFKNLVVDKLVPCPCAACKKDDAPHFFKYEVLKRRLQNGKTKTECEKSDEELYIAMVLKNANIQAVNIAEIRGLIAQYKPQEAVNLLKGLYPNEWAQMSGRLSQLSQSDRSGIIAHGEKSLEYNKWAQDFLAIAADLLR